MNQEKQIKTALEDGCIRGRLNKMIGEMATEDLREIYDLFLNKRLPNAEEIIEEVK